MLSAFTEEKPEAQRGDPTHSALCPGGKKHRPGAAPPTFLLYASGTVIHLLEASIFSPVK